jgi:hypothetical protein
MKFEGARLYELAGKKSPFLHVMNNNETFNQDKQVITISSYDRHKIEKSIKTPLFAPKPNHIKNK